MWIEWQTVVVSVGASALAISAMGFLVRSMIGHWLGKEFQKYVSDLAKSNARELERFKDELRGVAFLRETQFSRWHERRALVMAELYCKLARADVAFRDFTHPIRVGGELAQVASKENASKLGNDFFDYFNENDLFLTTEISGAAQQFWETMRRTWAEFAADPKGEKWTKAWEEYTVNAAILRERIRAAMREVLGGPDASI